MLGVTLRTLSPVNSSLLGHEESSNPIISLHGAEEMIWKIYAKHLYSVRLHPMKFDHSFHDRKQASSLGVPFAWSPKGESIFNAAQLPILPIPSFIHITNEYIEFDGWVFPIRGVKKGAVVWIRESCDRWIKEDDSKENLKWIREFLETFCCACMGQL